MTKGRRPSNAPACRARYQRLKAAGLCVACTAPTAGRVHCPSCAAKMDARTAARVAARLATPAPLCNRCVVRRPTPGMKTCASCRKTRRRNEKRHLAARRAYDRDRFNEYRRLGLCWRCGARDVRAGTSQCETCHAKDRAEHRSRRAAAMALPPDQRPCSACLARKPVAGGRTCYVCRERKRLAYVDRTVEAAFVAGTAPRRRQRKAA